MKIPPTLELEANEQPLGSWPCGVPSSPESLLTEQEGTLVLTDQRIIFEPLRLFRLLKVGPFRRLAGERRSIPLDLVQRAEIVEGRLPRLGVILDAQDPFIVFIAASRIPGRRRRRRALEETVELIAAATR